MDAAARPGRGASAAILSVRTGGRVLAIPASEVIEVARPLPLARLPLAPRAVLGLANLRGAAIPVLSLARLTGAEDGPGGASARLIVLRHRGAVLALSADRVEGFSPASAEDAAGAAADLAAMLADGLGVRQAGNDRAAPARLADRAAEEPQARAQALVVFGVAGQDFAVPAGLLSGAAALPKAWAPVPHAGGAMLGVVNFRGRTLPLICAASLLGLVPVADAARRILAVEAGQAGTIALTVDFIEGVRQVPPTDLDPVPPVLLRGRVAEAEIESVCRLDGGRRLVPVLAPARLFDAATLDRLAALTPAGPGAETERMEQRDDIVLEIRMGGDLFGLPVAGVAEILRRPAGIGALPGRASALILGVMVWRGAMIPLISGAARLGASDDDASGRLAIVLAGPSPVAITVSAVLGTRRMPAESCISLPPMGERLSPFRHALAGAGDSLVLPVLDPASIVAGLEHDLAAALSAAHQPRLRSDAELAL